MKPKPIKLIRILSNYMDFVAAATLAGTMDVSSRSIKSYIQEISSSCPDTIKSSREGCRVRKVIVQTVLSKTSTYIPQSLQKRVVYIINSLIKSGVPVDAYDLCDEVFIGYPTTKNELKAVERKLTKFGLQLHNSNGNWSVNGLEKSRRQPLSPTLYDESNVNFVSLEVIQMIFPEIDIKLIKSILLEVFDQFHYFVNDYLLINLALHITIAVGRIQNQNTNMVGVEHMPAPNVHEYEPARSITSKIEESFQVTYNQSEVYELTLLLISRATAIDYKSITTSNLQDFIGGDCAELVNELILTVSPHYYTDLAEPEFLIRFALYIRNLLQCSKSHYFNRNPLTEEIKTACPSTYGVLVFLSSIIEEWTGISINDNKTAHIVFHLGSTLEAQKNLSEKVTTVLYFPGYYNANVKLMDTINRYFSSELSVTNILMDKGGLESAVKNGFVLSTAPLSSVVESPFLQISPFFTEKDAQMVRKMLAEIKMEKRREQSKEYLEYSIIPDFFEKRSGLTNSSQVIHRMVENIMRMGYVDEDFEAEILDREQLSITAFQDFAIPHAMKMHANKTGLSVLISDKPVIQDAKRMHIVMMPCFNKEERFIFDKVFEPLTVVFGSRENIERLVQVGSYQEFIRMLTVL